MNEEGRIVWRLLFGVVMAGMLIGILLTFTSTQREYATGKEAQTLANNISKTAFSAVDSQQTFQLYESVGNSDYELSIENKTFTVQILDGSQEGKKYQSTIGIELEVRDSLPEPGEKLYLRGDGEKIYASSHPISLPKEEIIEPENFKPPDFYDFAKDNPKTATGLIAAYFDARQEYGKYIDISHYEWKSPNSLKARIVKNQNYLTTIKVQGNKNSDNVGYIEEVWTVENINETDGKNLANTCPSIKEASLTGWLYSPEEVERRESRRTWRNEDNEVVEIPQNLKNKASAATTNVSTYPTWRFEFKKNNTNYILHFGAIAWKPSEDKPGFKFETSPTLEADREV